MVGKGWRKDQCFYIGQKNLTINLTNDKYFEKVLRENQEFKTIMCLIYDKTKLTNP